MTFVPALGDGGSARHTFKGQMRRFSPSRFDKTGNSRGTELKQNGQTQSGRTADFQAPIPCVILYRYDLKNWHQILYVSCSTRVASMKAKTTTGIVFKIQNM